MMKSIEMNGSKKEIQKRKSLKKLDQNANQN